MEWRDPDNVCHAMLTESFSPCWLCYSLPMRDGRFYKFWVYILSSRSGTLYTGLTGFFEKRIHQHKYDTIEGFTKKCQCHRLVYYESYQGVLVAISREKQIKRWRREKKIFLIERMNPRCQDLAENWGRENAVSGRELGEKDLTVFVLQPSSGSLHSSSVSRLAGSFVVGRDDRRLYSSYLK